MHLVRSISSHSQGVLAPELLKRSAQSVGLAAAGDDFLAEPLQLIEAQIAAVLDDQLEAAGRAQAVDRRRAERRDDRPPHFLVATLLRAPWRSRRRSTSGRAARRTASGGCTSSPGWARWRSRSTTGRKGRPCARRPACRGPIASMRAIARCVRSTEAESGNCTLSRR